MALNSAVLSAAIAGSLSASLDTTAALLETPPQVLSAAWKAGFAAANVPLIKAIFDGIVASAPNGIANGIVSHLQAYAEVLPSGTPPLTINDGDGVTPVVGKGKIS